MTEERFGACLRRLRQAKGMSLRVLAGRLGLSPTYLHDVETEARGALGRATILYLADVLEIHPRELLIAAALSNPHPVIRAVAKRHLGLDGAEEEFRREVALLLGE